MKFKLKAPGTKCLKRKYDDLLSSFAFTCSLRRCNMGAAYLNGCGVPKNAALATQWLKMAAAGAAHSSTSQLNLSRFTLSLKPLNAKLSIPQNVLR